MALTRRGRARVADEVQFNEFLEGLANNERTRSPFAPGGPATHAYTMRPLKASKTPPAFLNWKAGKIYLGKVNGRPQNNGGKGEVLALRDASDDVNSLTFAVSNLLLHQGPAIVLTTHDSTVRETALPRAGLGKIWHLDLAGWIGDSAFTGANEVHWSPVQCSSTAEGALQTAVRYVEAANLPEATSLNVVQQAHNVFATILLAAYHGEHDMEWACQAAARGSAGVVEVRDAIAKAGGEAVALMSKYEMIMSSTVANDDLSQVLATMATVWSTDRAKAAIGNASFSLAAFATAPADTLYISMAEGQSDINGYVNMLLASLQLHLQNDRKNGLRPLLVLDDIAALPPEVAEVTNQLEATTWMSVDAPWSVLICEKNIPAVAAVWGVDPGELSDAIPTKIFLEPEGQDADYLVFLRGKMVRLDRTQPFHMDPALRGLIIRRIRDLTARGASAAAHLPTPTLSKSAIRKPLKVAAGDFLSAQVLADKTVFETMVDEFKARSTSVAPLERPDALYPPPFCYPPDVLFDQGLDLDFDLGLKPGS